MLWWIALVEWLTNYDGTPWPPPTGKGGATTNDDGTPWWPPK